MNQLNIEDTPKEEGPKPFAKIDLVSEGSPADDAGIKVGDLVIEFGTQNATNFKSLAEIGQLVNKIHIQSVPPIWGDIATQFCNF
jgi:S1-C subfamily serine protease